MRIIFSATPAEMIGLGIFNPGLVKLIRIFSVPLNIFFIVFLKPLPSIWNCFGLEVICFWQLHVGLCHISCNFKTVQFLFKPHHAELHIADRHPCLQAAVPI